MRIYAVSAHDHAQSLCETVFAQACRRFEQSGHEVSSCALYDYENEIPFYGPDREKLNNNAFFQTMQYEILKADALFLVFPVFWYGPPAILKAWCDLIVGYAWKYEGGDAARPRHHIKNVFWINSCMAYAPYEKEYGSIASRQLEETFRWMGMPQRSWYEIIDVFSHDQKTLEQHIERAVSSASTWFSYDATSVSDAPGVHHLERDT